MDPVLIVVLIGVVGLVVIGGVTAFLFRAEAAVEEVARADLETAAKVGALPPSLHPKIDPAVCMGSGSCVAACPEKDVIGLVSGKAHLVNPTSCIGHGECLAACPVEAISLVLGNARRGVDIPLVNSHFETSTKGLYIVGELGGMGLIYNATTQALQCMDGILATMPDKQEGVHQLVVVGCGPAGLAASLKALEEKLDFVTLDQDSVGGTVLHFPRHKLVMTRPVILPLYGKFHFSEISKEELLETWNGILEKTGLQVRTHERVDGVVQRDDGIFEVTTAKGTLLAQRVIMALGRRGSPRKLGVPGEELSKVCYRLLEPERYAGSKCLVVGGGNSGVEAAMALGKAGADVHLAHRRGVFDRIAKKNAAKLDEAIEAGTVKVLLTCKPTEIKKTSVVVTVDGEPREIDNDYVLVFAGGVLPTKMLEGAGVTVQSFKGEKFAPANPGY